MTRSKSDLDLLLSAAGDDLDRRIERHRSAAGTGQSRFGRAAHRTRLVITAAFLVAAVAGIAFVASRSSTSKSIIGSPSTAASSLPESASTVPTSAVPQPARVAVFDPQLGLGEPTRPDPAFTWLHSSDLTDQWFVRRSPTGEPVGGLQVGHLPASEWDKSFSDGTPIDIGASVEARIMADAARPTIGWRTSEGVTDVSAVGDTDLTEVTTAARLAATAPSGTTTQIDGFEPVPTPVTVSVVSYDNGLSLTMNQLPGLDAATLAFFDLGGAAQADGAIWVAHLGGATVAFADLRSDAQVVARIPDGTAVDITSLIASVRFVDPASVAIHSLPSDVPPGAVYDTGVSTAGRWRLATWTEGDGQACFLFETSFAGSSGGCVPNGSAKSCWSIVGWGVDTGAYFAVLVAGEAQTLTAVIDDVETPATIVEQGARYTLAVGYPPAEVQRTTSFLIDGRPTTC